MLTQGLGDTNSSILNKLQMRDNYYSLDKLVKHNLFEMKPESEGAS